MDTLMLGGAGQVGTELRQSFWPAGVRQYAPDWDSLDINDEAALARVFGARSYNCLFGTGMQFRMSFSYVAQSRPEGLRQGFEIGRGLAGTDPLALILGDNLFFAVGISELFASAAKQRARAKMLAYRVESLRAYEAISHSRKGWPTQIVDNPRVPDAIWAMTGLYCYNSPVLDILAGVRTSARGELEFMSVNKAYGQHGQFAEHRMAQGYGWLDTSANAILLKVSRLVSTIQNLNGCRWSV